MLVRFMRYLTTAPRWRAAWWRVPHGFVVWLRLWPYAGEQRSSLITENAGEQRVCKSTENAGEQFSSLALLQALLPSFT